MFLTIEPYLHLNCVLMLNWIEIELFLTLKVYLYKTELLYIELFWHFTM